MKKYVLIGLLLSVCAFVGCGGSSSSSGGGTTPATLVSIQVTPATPSIALGATQQFTATGSYSDGTTKSLSANWLSSTASVATINTSGLATGVGGGTTTISASSGNITGTTTLTVTNPLVSITLTPATASVAVNGTQQYMATGKYTDGSTQNITSTVTWQSSVTTVASINAAGLAIAKAAGNTTITAAQGSITSSPATLTVTNPLVSIAVTPASVSLAPNATQQYTATGTYADSSTQNLTSTVTWHATAGATITAAGLATAVTPGATSTITATQGTVTSNSASLTVTNPLVSIAVAPATISLAPNATQQYTATGTFADQSTHDITGSVTWSASTGATITAGGLAMAVTPNTTVTIMAIQGNISGTAIMTVTNPLVSIAVTPANPSVSAGFTQQFVATGTYADNSTQILTTRVTWASSNPSVASISNTQGSQGLATGIAAGTVQITATSGSIIGSTTLTVTSANLVSIAVTPVGQQIVYQTQQQYTATGTFTDSSTHDITNTVTWTSSDTAHLTITPTGIGGGLATGVATTANPVTIQASQNGINGSTTATVVAAIVTSVAITPNNPPNSTNLAVGTSRHYTATATLANGSTLNVTTQASWTSSNPSAASVVSNSGLVRATTINANAGTTVITATYNGVSSNFTLSVNVASVQSITVTPVSPTVPAGVTQRFYATAVFDNSPTQDISSDATWNSSNQSAATIDSTGLASTLAMNSTTNITATFGGMTSSPAVLTVDSSTLNSIAITPVSTVLPVGKTINYNAYGTYGDGLTFVLTSLAQWSSSNPTSVSITQTGLGSTLTPAPPVTISAVYQGQTGTATVIVTQSSLASIAVTPTTATIPVSVSTPFTAIGTFADSSTQNLTGYATWATNPSSVATINSGAVQPGVATGLTPGQASVTAVFAGVISNNAALTISNATIVSLTVTPNPAYANQGGQLQFKAFGKFSDQSTIDLTNQANWTSSDATVATINNSGVASIAGTSGKTTVITATFGSATGTSILTVN